MAKIYYFRLVSGTHVGCDETGKRGVKWNKGDTITTKQNLAESHGANKFHLLKVEDEKSVAENEEPTKVSPPTNPQQPKKDEGSHHKRDK